MTRKTDIAKLEAVLRTSIVCDDVRVEPISSASWLKSITFVRHERVVAELAGPLLRAGEHYLLALRGGSRSNEAEAATLVRAEVRSSRVAQLLGRRAFGSPFPSHPADGCHSRSPDPSLSRPLSTPVFELRSALRQGRACA